VPRCSSPPFEAGPAVGISGHVSQKDSDRDGAIQAGVTGFVDFAHSSGPDLAEDLVRAQPRARGKGQGWCSTGGQFREVVLHGADLFEEL
jgi:hypothetical protein